MSKTRNEKLAALGRIVTVAAASFMLAAVVPTLALSDDVITGCFQKCQTGGCGGDLSCRTAANGKCKLNGDITCTSTSSLIPAVQLIDGTDLDLAGNDITCTAAQCNYPVVTMYNTGSKVMNSGGSAVISGPFTWGVNCGSYSGSVVENVTFSSAAAIGVSNCQTVRHNVFDGSGAARGA
ncbi:hypothetical protein K2Z84_13885 [Candidatus Binatia bacterium]|nr:hypothetical protein [Candidatus Binatia bacterium]